jgi:hypothetical protein
MRVLQSRIRKPKPRLLIATIALTAATSVVAARAVEQETAAQASPITPTVEQILDKYVQALGGKEAVQKPATCVMKGSITTPATGEKGSIEVYRKAPNKQLIVIDIASNGGPTPQGYNGSAAWYVDPDDGPQDMDPDGAAAMKFQSEFYRDIRLKELYSRFAFGGTAKVGGRDAYVIEATRRDGGQEKMYFDTASGLMVRNDTPYVTPDGEGTMESIFEDFQAVDGIQMAFTVRQSTPDFDYVIRYQEIRYNVPIDDAKFEKPAKQ